MKVILTDNFDRDWKPDKLIAEGLTEEKAEQLASDKNARCSPHGDAWYVAVPDDYKLKTGEP